MGSLSLCPACLFIGFGLFYYAMVSASDITDSMVKTPDKFDFIDAGSYGLWAAYANQTQFAMTANDGTEWKRISGRFLKGDLGRNVAWTINELGIIWMRTGVSESDVAGTNWTLIASPSGSTPMDISVSEVDNAVWMVDTGGRPWRRAGITEIDLKGTGWSLVDGRCKYISVGGLGVFCVNAAGNIYNRIGTEGNGHSHGTHWHQWTSGTLQRISVCSTAFWGVNSVNQLWRWDSATGLTVHLRGIEWSTISCSDSGRFAGLDTDNNAYITPLGEDPPNPGDGLKSCNEIAGTGLKLCRITF